MKLQQSWKLPGKGWGAAIAALVVGSALAAGQAEAALPGTAGNAIVRNTITVNYADAKGNGQPTVSSSVDVTVNTVAATPTIISPIAGSPGSTDGTGATAPYTFSVRTNSNGPGTVALSVGDCTATANNCIAPSNMSVSTTTPTEQYASFYLGATTFDPNGNGSILGAAQNIAANGTITIAVPADGGIAGTSDTGGTHSLPDTTTINGLTVNDTVYITDGTTAYGPFIVQAVSDPAVPATTTNNAVPAGSLTLKNASSTTAIPTFTPQVGWQIVESKTVNVTTYQGIIPVASANGTGTWYTQLTAAMAGATAANSPIAQATAHLGRISISKYVRNVTHSAMTGSNPIAVTFNSTSNTYYGTGVTGNPGDVLEYLAVLSDDGTGNSQAVYATDVAPTYSALVTGSSYGTGSGNVFAMAKIGTATTGTEVSLSTTGSGQANIAYGKTTTSGSTTTMYYNFGTGASNTFPTGGGGTLTPGQTGYVIYQVKIN
ncbi:hypothetical protein L4X63_02565 [Geomonas sp. Red32]|uniref:hypothetical protein n=1 Tax=Geomonas sp. Red32 TaxID=2912856 RepID=UPI00202CB974|nr:hypothetical protein [Geomonas sp. Red32]MCM0080464.1 hypothetical protein [Geomonas sp. Red32]